MDDAEGRVRFEMDKSGKKNNLVDFDRSERSYNPDRSCGVICVLQSWTHRHFHPTSLYRAWLAPISGIYLHVTIFVWLHF